MGLTDWLRGKGSEERDSYPLSVDSWAQFFSYLGNSYTITPQQTLSGEYERIGSDFTGLVQGAYKSNGVVFACMLVRQLLFSEAKFQYRQRRAGRPGDLFGDANLGVLENPWPGATTGDLLTRAIQDADLAGNFFAVRRPGPRIRRLRPDWVDLVIGSMSGDEEIGDVDAEVLGYLYYPGGRNSGRDAVPFDRTEVAHFAPIPDPTASFRGMSWLTPVIREIQADSAMTTHKQSFVTNGATPNMVVKLDAKPDDFARFVKMFEEKHEGAANAAKTLFLAGGADVTVVGSNFREMSFKETQGAGEPLALDTPIPTPTGWTTMGEVAVGDFVVGSDGLPARVAGVSAVHRDRQCYRVTFNDRTSIVADGGHLWAAMDRNTASRAEQTYTTEQLRDGIAAWRVGGNRYAVRPLAAMKTPDADLLIDPYVLGAWLGDGQTAGAAICGAEEDLGFIANEIEQRGYTVTRWNTSPDKVPVIGLPGGLLAALRAVGVLGDKHIPAEYLRASIEQRVDLLRGLMDTDGSVGHIGKESAEFSSKYERLARQVAEIVRSLGHRATVSRKVEPRSRTGETWRVTFRVDPDMVPFLLPRKVARCVTPLHVRNRAVVSVEPVESVPVRCIAVETADHLFAAGEGWTLTHNTRIAAAAGVPPVIVGLSEGLQQATYSNYAQARRRFADGTMRPLWRNMAGSMANIIPVPGGAELWYDDRDVPFIREDLKDEADIQAVHATTVKTFIDAGFKPEDVVKAVVSGDLSRLATAHTGLNSVQLQPPMDPNAEPKQIPNLAQPALPNGKAKTPTP